MKQTEVFLLEYIENLGAEGDVVKVRPGYARNFLLPRRLALPVNMANEKLINARKKAREEREANMLAEAQELAKKLEGLSLAFPVKTGHEGKVFGSVTQACILARLQEEGIEINKKHIHLGAPVKTLGQHSAKLKLHHDISVDLKFDVVSENPIKEQAASAA